VLETFTKTFPNDANIRAASKALISLSRGQKYIDSKLEGTDINENAPHSLDAEDVIKAMEISDQPTRMNTAL
jgi:hypothetical protein